MVWKNPQGFTDPCSQAERYPYTAGADALVAYFRQNPGFNVIEATPLQIDGHHAVHLVTEAKTDYAGCPGQELLLFTPKSCDCHWIAGPGFRDSYYVVDVGAGHPGLRAQLGRSEDRRVADHEDPADPSQAARRVATCAPAWATPSPRNAPPKEPLPCSTMPAACSRPPCSRLPSPVPRSASRRPPSPDPTGGSRSCGSMPMGSSRCWAANPDLTHQVQLTAGPSDAWFPAWSPDGRRIAFASHRSDPTRPTTSRSWTCSRCVPTDGRPSRHRFAGFSGTPSWSPDGRWLVFSADRADYPRGQGIYITRSDGSSASHRMTGAAGGPGMAGAGPLLARRLAHRVHRIPRRVLAGRRRYAVGRRAECAVHRQAGRIAPATHHRLGAQRERRRLVARWTATRLRHPTDVGRRPAGGDDRGRRWQPPAKPEPRSSGVAAASPNDDYRESFNPAWSPDGREVVFVHAQYSRTTASRWACS